jgi:hypothetical protein
METIRDQKFAGRSFVIDETVFINCQLTDCDLYLPIQLRGGPADVIVQIVH